MYIPTIDKVNREDFKKSFELGKHLYNYERHHRKSLFERNSIRSTKHHINSFLHDYELKNIEVEDVKEFSPNDILDPLQSYNLSFQTIAWAGYFSYAILLALRKHKPETLKDEWVIILSYSLDNNPGYAESFFDSVVSCFKGPNHIEESFKKLMKTSYFDTYGEDYSS